MQLLNIFKKKNKAGTRSSSKQQLFHIIDYIPGFYKNQRQYINAVDYLERDELGLSLESLIELAEETGHYFSDGFWQALADTANSMGLFESSSYCLKQIGRSQEDLQPKTPFGWTTVKIDDNHFQHHILQRIKDGWVAERHKKDDVIGLLGNADGIYLKMNGRSGTLYVIDRGNLAEVDLEIGVPGLLLYFRNTTHWMLPLKRALTAEEKDNIKALIYSWAISSKNAVEFVD